MDYFDAPYQGGSASRSEDNFIRIRDLLRTGLILCDLCAGLDEALVLIPGAHTSDQTNSTESLGPLSADRNSCALDNTWRSSLIRLPVWSSGIV